MYRIVLVFVAFVLAVAPPALAQNSQPAQQIDARATRLQADQRRAAIRSALGQIDLARFWSQPEAVIHQQLHALMDGVKVEVLDGVIVALRPK